MYRDAIIRPARILLIEKDSASAAKIAAALQEAGLEVLKASDALGGLRKLYEAHPDVVIMTRELPMLNGEEPYLRIRQASYLPIIVLGNEGEALEILELGADVFMVKPPSLNELVARVHSLLRRKPKGGSPGGNCVSPVNNYSDQAEKGSSRLTSTELRLASCLTLNKGRLLSYRQLVTEVWGGKSVSMDNLHFYMRRLRRKLVNSSIIMLRGIGYCLSDAAKAPAENEEVVPMGEISRIEAVG